MPSPLIPAERLRDALEVVRQSIEDFSLNNHTWLTQAPSYSTSPTLLPAASASPSSPPTSSSSSSANGKRPPAFRPDAETLAKVYCPITGPRWDEQRTKTFASTTIKGLTILRNQIDAELVTLQKIAAENGNWQDPQPFPNGPHHMHYWEEILYVAFTSGPVVSIQDRFSFDMDLALHRKKRMQRSQVKAKNSQSCKVDIVSKGGDRWTRLYIIKFERLRAEFREAESYMVESDESEDDGGDDDGPGTERPKQDVEQNPAMDTAARNFSLMKTVRELRAAADTEVEARVQRSTKSGRPSVLRPIEIELIITRIDIADDVSEPSNRLSGDGEKGKPFYQQDEACRFQARLRAIIKEADRLGITVVFGFRRLPTELFGRFEYPSIAIYGGSDLPIGLPKIPMPPPRPKWTTTRRINLDVTAMFALVSDITHGVFDDVPQTRTQKAESSSGVFGGGSDEADPTFQDHFRTFSIRKEALEARAAELMLNDAQPEEAVKAMDNATSKEGRALAIQLERELTFETLFDAIFEPILSSSAAEHERKVELLATVGALDRLRRVSSTVGGTNEKRRVAALLGDYGTTPDDFWRGSKWSTPAHDQLRACLQLPVRPLSDLGPGDFDTIDALSAVYPDLARQHFVSHLLDTLESCLTELWGPEWRDISEDLPRSKYKKLKQHSVHQAGGQTYTTLRSMHACARHGMTTLTSNMDSVQWLLKEMNRRPYSAKTQAVVDRATSQRDLDALFDPNATYEACFLLLHPRSLSEQMRTTSAAPPWREVLAGYPGNMGSPTSGRSTPKSEIQPQVRGQQQRGHNDDDAANVRPTAYGPSNGSITYDSVYGIELPRLDREPNHASGSSSTDKPFFDAAMSDDRH